MLNISFFIERLKLPGNTSYTTNCWKEKQRCQLTLQPMAVALRYKREKPATAFT